MNNGEPVRETSERLVSVPVEPFPGGGKTHSMIDVENLKKRFSGITAVDGVSFHVPRGQLVGFLGPNGAGKSTTMRIMTGFFPPTSGSVRIDGIDVIRDSLGVRRRIGYLPESVPLYTDMRVVEYLDYRARLKGLRQRAERRSRITDVLGRCGLEAVRRKMIGHLSKGYRQRVGIADVLVHDPPVLILDEPTVGLDPSQIREIRELIRQLGETHTVILSTHILQEVEMVCDRVILIAKGKVVRDGPMDDFREDGELRLEEWFLRLAGAEATGSTPEAAQAAGLGDAEAAR